MRSAYPDRRFLLLMDSSEETELIKDILKSPLDQASKLITSLFEERLGEVKDGLDVIKQFAAGIGRAEKLAEGYTLAAYYPFLFAFHQNFHSSFRARQGKVLERMVQRILQKYGRGAHVPDSNKERLTLLGEVFGSVELPKLDIDVLAVDVTNKKTLIIQLRSRDDTGGTTAKGSLVDFLRELLRLNTVPQGDVLYLVCVSDPRDAQQKRSTVNKMFSAPKDFISAQKCRKRQRRFRMTQRDVQTPTNLSERLANNKKPLLSMSGWKITARKFWLLSLPLLRS